MRPIVIKERKYKDNTVLIAVYKVRAVNTIAFTEDREFAGRKFTCDGLTIKKYPIVSNGVLDCYAVPVGELKPLRGKRTEGVGANAG